MTLPHSVNGVRLRNGVEDARVTQHLDYWLLTARELQQYLSWTEEAARAYKQMEPVIRQAAKDWARISATAQKHVAKIARFRAKREKQNERTKKLLTELLGTGCPLDDCTGELIGQDREEDERYAEMIGARFEILCTVCDAEMYPPPAMRLQQHGAEYFRAGRELLRSTKPQSVGMPTIFVLHQAAELYLKSLGTLNVYRGDTDDETPAGPGLENRKHDLDRLLSKVYPSIRRRLEEHYAEATAPRQTVEALIGKIPQQTAEVCRYGHLFKGQYPEGCITTNGMVIRTENGTETNVTQVLMELCALLDGFVGAESPW